MSYLKEIIICHPENTNGPAPGPDTISFFLQQNNSHETSGTSDQGQIQR